MGHNPHWGFLLVLYFFIGGIAAGAYFVAALADFLGDEKDRPIVMAGYKIAFPLTLVLPILLMLDLGTPSRAFNMFITLKFDSPMSVGSWALAGFALFTFASWYLANKEESMPNAVAIRRKIGIVGGLFGFFIASYTGVLLGTTNRPFWGGTNLLGALFLASAGSTGVAAIALYLHYKDSLSENLWKHLSTLDEAILLLEVVALAAFLGLLGETSAPVVTGQFALIFWSFLILGLGVPFFLQFGMTFFNKKFPSTPANIRASTLLLLLGGLILRYLVVAAGQA